MIFLTAIMCALLGYQVTMPANDNAKFMFSSHQDYIVRMNTQDGSMEKCDASFKCEKVNND
jgi:hypothetical protein